MNSEDVLDSWFYRGFLPVSCIFWEICNVLEFLRNLLFSHSSISGTDYLKGMIQKQTDNSPCLETPAPVVTDDQNERSCPEELEEEEDLFGRKAKKQSPDAMQWLQQFLSYPVSEFSNEILEWPKLKDIFLELNTAMPSSAASERFFSAASQIFLPRRSRINDCNFQKQLICKVNCSFA